MRRLNLLLVVTAAALASSARSEADPAVIRREFSAGGFLRDGASAALRNPDDDVTKPMYQAAVAHMTDRVLLRFREP
jgi:predicted methyltransferase